MCRWMADSLLRTCARYCCALLSVAGALLAADPASAQTVRTWTGAASTAWSNPSNWSPAGIPTSGETLVFSNVGANRLMINDVAGLVIGSVVVNDNQYTFGGAGLTLAPSGTSTISRDVTVLSLSGGGTIQFDNGKLLVMQAGDTTFAGTFVGNNGQVIKDGAGTLTLTGNGAGLSRMEVRSGLVLVDGGTLGPSYVEGGSGRIAVTGGGTVAQVTVNNGQFGDDAPGTGTTGFLLVNNGTYNQVIAGDEDFDRMLVNGTVQFGGPRLNVTLQNGYVPPVGKTFIIIDNDGTDSVVNHFQGLDEGATITLGGVVFRISYKAGTGNDVGLTVVQSPGTPPPTPVPDLTIAKSHTGSFTVGTNGVYRIAVTNAGTGASSGQVTITDTLPAGFVPVSAAGTGWTCTLGGATVTCMRSDALASAATYPEISLTVAVAANAVSATNTAIVSGGGETNTTNDTATDPTMVVQAPDLTIVKRAASAFDRPGTGTFSIDVTNVGAQATDGTVTVTDTLPAGLVPLRVVSNGWNCTIGSPIRQAVSCTRADALAAGQSYPTLQIVADIQANAADTISNTARVSGGGDTTPGNNSSTVQVEIVTRVPDLRITKSHVDPFTRSQQGATFSIGVQNVGQGATSGPVQVQDALPAGLTPTAASGTGWTCGIQASTVSCSRDDGLAAGSAYPGITIAVNVSASAASVTNVATVAGGGDQSPANNTASDPVTITGAVVTPSPSSDLTIHKSHASGEIVQGGSVTFRIDVSNVADDPTDGDVTVLDELPTGLTPTSASGEGWQCVIAGQSVTCRRGGSIAGHASASSIAIAADVAVNAVSTVNTATVSGGGDTSPANNSASDPVTITGLAPDLAIAKSHTGTFAAGGQAAFQLDVRNVGGGAAKGQVVVSDTMPPGLQPTTASGAGWTCRIAAPAISCSRADGLAPGAAFPAIAVAAAVDITAVSSVNVATVSVDGDASPANNSASDPYVVAGVPNLVVTKSHAGDFAVNQRGAIYTIVVRNVGGAPTNGPVTVTDVVPTGLTPATAAGAGWQCVLQGQTVTCARADALAVQSAFPPIALGVDAPPIPGELTNVVHVAGGGDVTPADNMASDPTRIVGQPQLTITKSHLEPVVQGQRGLPFTITVFNNGTAPTSAPYAVVDTLPAGLQVVDAVGAGWTCDRKDATVTCSRADALASGTAAPAIVLTVDVDAAATTTVNDARVSGGGDTTPNDNVAHDRVVITPAGVPNLTIRKSHDGDFAQGQRGAIYRLIVSNDGQAPTSGIVTVTDELPAGFTPTRAAGTGWTCDIAGQIVRCTRADALPGAGTWPDIQVTVDISTTAVSATNVATVSGGGDTTPNDSRDGDTTVVVPVGPDLTLTKAHADPFVPGEADAVYRIDVRNVGTGPTSGEVVVTDELPAGLVPVDASGAGWACAVNGATVTCRRSDVLAPGQSYAEIALRVNVLPTATTAVNVARVSGGGDTTPGNNDVSDATSVLVTVDPTVTLRLDTPLVVGNEADYRGAVLNLGPGALTGPSRVVIDVDPQLVPVAGIGAGWTCDVSAHQIICTRRDALGVNEAFPDILARVRVRATNGPVTMMATVVAANDANETNNVATVTTVPDAPRADLRVSKTVSASRAGIGSTLTYRVTISNAGTGGVTGSVLRDLLPRGFVPALRPELVTGTTRSPRAMTPTPDGIVLEWEIGTLAPDDVVTVDYTVTVGAEARQGPQVNRAEISGRDAFGAAVTAGPATATVVVEGEAFTMLQALVGRVFEDVDGNGRYTGADRAIAGARVITSTGQAAITDPNGLYNIPSLGAGSVAVSLDKDTVPAHLTIEGDGPGDRSWTRLLRTPIGGGALLRQNFALQPAAGTSAPLPPAAPVEAAKPPDNGEALAALDGAGAGHVPPRREYESRTGSSLLVALGEVSFGNAAPEFELFEKDGRAWGYGSVFFQSGLFSPKNRFTLAFDSHRALNGTSSSDRLFELDPIDRVYPVFGDTSARQELATSNAKVFARIDRGASFVQFGDLIGDLTSSDHDGGRWSSYQRHLTGAEVHLAGARGSFVTVRTARLSTSYQRDVFAGTVTRLISLSRTSVLAGTETIAVEVRDRRSPERVLSRTVLVPGVDYTLQPDAGSVFLTHRIGGLDDALNLVQVTATYEYESAGVENLLFNGRAVRSFGGLRLGATVFSEEGAGDGRFTVGGIDVDQTLPNGGRLRVDLPYSRGVPRVGDTVGTTAADGAQVDGLAVQADLSQPMTFWNGKIAGAILRADRDFHNPFAATITPGAQLASGSIEVAPWHPLRVRVGAADERYDADAADARRTTISGSLSQAVGPWTFSGGYDARHLDRNGERIDSELLSVGAALAARRFDARILREENLRGRSDPTYPDQTTLGAGVRVGKRTRIFYTQRISDAVIEPIGDFSSTGFTQLPTKGEMNLGVESHVADNTVLTSGYQVQDGLNGPDAFAVIGVVTQVSFGGGFSGTFGADHGTPVSDATRPYTTGSLGLAWTAKDRVKATSRYEIRNRDGIDASLVMAGLAARLHGGLTALLRGQWLNSEDLPVATDALSLLAAFAVRPVRSDRAGLLFSYQHADGPSTLQTIGPDRNETGWHHRLSTDGYVQPLRRLELYGKAAWQRYPGVDRRVDTVLGQGRVQLTLLRYLDAAIEERYIFQQQTHSTRESTGAELGVWPMADLRAAIGYHFQDTRDPYGRDLEGRAKGVYVTLSTKLSRLFNLMGSAPPAADGR